MIGNDIIDLSQIRQWHKERSRTICPKNFNQTGIHLLEGKTFGGRKLNLEILGTQRKCLQGLLQSNKKRFFAPKQFQIDIQSLIFYNEKIAPSIKFMCPGKNIWVNTRKIRCSYMPSFTIHSLIPITFNSANFNYLAPTIPYNLKRPETKLVAYWPNNFPSMQP